MRATLADELANADCACDDEFGALTLRCCSAGSNGLGRGGGGSSLSGCEFERHREAVLCQGFPFGPESEGGRAKGGCGLVRKRDRWRDGLR